MIINWIIACRWVRTSSSLFKLDQTCFVDTKKKQVDNHDKHIQTKKKRVQYYEKHIDTQKKERCSQPRQMLIYKKETSKQPWNNKKKRIYNHNKHIHTKKKRVDNHDKHIEKSIFSFIYFFVEKTHSNFQTVLSVKFCLSILIVEYTL